MTDDNINMRWWDHPDNHAGNQSLAQDVVKVYDHLKDADSYRQRQNLHHLRLYGNHAVMGVNPKSYNQTAAEERVTFNVIGSVCDLAAARIGKLRPAPKFLPQGGNQSLERRSRLLGRFMKAQFRISKVYPTTSKVFLDAAVFGTGCLKAYARRDEIIVERIFPSELFVDPLEGLYGEPRMIIQRKWISKAVLLEEYAGSKRQIGKKERSRLRRVIEDSGGGLEPDSRESYLVDDSVSDQVLVLEAWRLPSGPGAGDGKHAIVTDAGYLHVGEWKKDKLPFLFIPWRERLRGFWGQGLAEMLNGIQREINILLMKVQRAHAKLGHPLVFIDGRSSFDKNTMTTEAATFVPFMGQPPQVVVFQSVHPEIYAQIDRLRQAAYDIAGMSQDSAAPGTKSISGISAQTQHEIGSERFVRQGQAFEQLHLDLAEMMIEIAKDIQKKYPDFSQPAEHDRRSVSHVKWKDVDMKRDEYVIQVLPVSSLPQLPGPKQDRVAGLLEMGVIDASEAAELLDMPDLDWKLDFIQASRRAAERAVENMVDENVYEPPDPLLDLRLGMKIVQHAYAKALNDGVEEERIQLLRMWTTEAQRMMQKAQVEQMKLAQAAAAQGEPVAPAPGAPPAPGPNGQPPMASTATAGPMGM